MRLGVKSMRSCRLMLLSFLAVLLDDFFITKYSATEFPYSSTDGRRMLAALSSYLNDEPVFGVDLVAWYRLSFVHHPRTEDYPAQPIVWNSFE